MGLSAFSEFEVWQTDGAKIAQGVEILTRF